MTQQQENCDCILCHRAGQNGKKPSGYHVKEQWPRCYICKMPLDEHRITRANRAGRLVVEKAYVCVDCIVKESWRQEEKRRKANELSGLQGTD